MSHGEKFIRKSVAAVGIVLAGFALDGCTSAQSGSSGSSFELNHPNKSGEDLEAEAKLFITSRQVAGRILHDIGEPASESESYTQHPMHKPPRYGVAIGNVDYLRANPSERKHIPETYAYYAQDWRQVVIGLCQSKQANTVVHGERCLTDSVQFVYDTGNTANYLDRQLAEGEALTLNDFKYMLGLDSLKPEAVYYGTPPQDPYSSIESFADISQGDYQYLASNPDGSLTVTPYGKYDSEAEAVFNLSLELENTEKKLAHELVSN